MINANEENTKPLNFVLFPALFTLHITTPTVSQEWCYGVSTPIDLIL